MHEIAIVANGAVFADALVAGPLSARRSIPVLLTSKDQLHPEVAGFLADAGVERVLLMGGTAALSAQVETSISELGISVERMAGATRFETGILTGQFAAELVGGGCFSGASVGLARARVPFDSFSAAPLMARRCAPVVLTDPDEIQMSTAEFLDGVRRSTDNSEIALTVFGGDAAVSQESLDTDLAADASEDGDEPAEEPAAAFCGGDPDAPPSQLVAGSTFAREPVWSPDCSHVAYVDIGALKVADVDGSNGKEVFRILGAVLNKPAWSPDGRQIALDTGQRLSLMNADGTNLRSWAVAPRWSTRLSWSPDGTQLALGRIAGPTDNPSNVETNIAVFDVATGSVTDITTMDGAELNPQWSPDGQRIVFNTRADGGRDTRIWVMGAEYRSAPMSRNSAHQYTPARILTDSAHR